MNQIISNAPLHDYDIWESEYKVVPNHLNPDAPYNGMFETYGQEEAYIIQFFQKNPQNVWTILEVNGLHCIVSGFHLVDRYGYLITEKAFNPNDEWNIYDSEDIPKVKRRMARSLKKLIKEQEAGKLVMYVAYGSDTQEFVEENGWEKAIKSKNAGEGEIHKRVFNTEAEMNAYILGMQDQSGYSDEGMYQLINPPIKS